MTAAATSVAGIVALCIPLGYLWVVFEGQLSRLDYATRIVSVQIVAEAEADMRGAGHKADKLRSLLGELAELDDTWIEVKAPDGSEIMRSSDREPWPALWRQGDVVRDGKSIAVLRTAAPLHPLFGRIVGVTSLSFALAAFAYAVMRNLSLRALTLAFEKLRRANANLVEINSKLREQTERLCEAQELGKIAYWTYMASDRRYWWSPEMYRLLARSPENFPVTPKAIAGICQGDAALKIRSSQRRALREGTVETADIRLVRGDGTVGSFSITCKPLLDGEGTVIGVSGTMQDITARAHSEARLHQLAHYDPLTGLANRSLVNGALADAIAETEETGGISALVLIDLDNFKDVNDTLGHAAGDDLLIEVVRRIRAVLSSDDFFARLGGDEFAVLLKNMTTRQDIEGAALRVLAAASGQIALPGGDVVAGASIGIAIVGVDGRAPSELMRNADLALYRSKAGGRGIISFFALEMDEEVQTKANLARDLRNSLATETGLDLHYQPQVDLVTGRVIGFEALLRWTHPQRGAISPAEFIPIAESSRLICDLGGWVLRKATRQAKDWLLAGGPAREVAVNISAAQILHADLVSDVDRALAESGLPPHLLCLELTESLMANPDDAKVRAVLAELKARGVSLALDDFGTGYSSLGHLSDLPFDKIKIDRMFVSSLTSSPHARELLKGIITLGHGLRMKVHVEGAEKIEEVRTLSDFAADYVQGFAISRAVPAEQAIAFARECDSHEICEDMLEVLDERMASAA